MALGFILHPDGDEFLLQAEETEPGVFVYGFRVGEDDADCCCGGGDINGPPGSSSSGSGSGSGSESGSMSSSSSGSMSSSGSDSGSSSSGSGSDSGTGSGSGSGSDSSGTSSGEDPCAGGEVFKCVAIWQARYDCGTETWSQMGVTQLSCRDICLLPVLNAWNIGLGCCPASWPPGPAPTVDATYAQVVGECPCTGPGPNPGLPSINPGTCE